MSVSYTHLNQPSITRGKSNSADKQMNNSATPLLSKIEGAPIAKSELDDDSDDREILSHPFPGVDDGFFDKDENPKTDVETIDPSHPNFPETEDNKPRDADDWPNDIPSLSPRIGPGSENIPDIDKDDPDGPRPRSPYPASDRPHYLTPGFGFDPEIGSTIGGTEIPDVNIYQHKKTLAQGMMDLALFSANANQLRYVLESFARHPYYYPSIVLISLSLLLQIAVGVGLIWNATYNVKDEKEICIANKISNFTIIGIFLVTIINVFISAFGVADAS